MENSSRVVLFSASCVLSPLQADLWFVVFFLFDLFFRVKLIRFFFFLFFSKERPLFFFVSSQSKTFEISLPLVESLVVV